MSAWQALHDECARWNDAGRTADLWWRDDDAGSLDTAVERLLSLAERHDVPLALAVVPERADRLLFARLGNPVSVLQHGTDHRNRAAAGEKKTEFASAEPETAVLERLAAGRTRLAQLAGDRLLPVLAPPWNRVPDALVPRLAGAGYRGLSRFGARRAALAGIREVNTHVDIIAWRKDRAFVGEAVALEALVGQLAAQRLGQINSVEPTGLLTHHAVHDAAAWNFLERLLETARSLPGLRWRAAQELFHA